MIEPTYTLTVGDTAFDSQVVRLRCRRAIAPETGGLTVLLPYRTHPPVALNDDVTLELDAGDPDVPDAAGTVFTGTVTSLTATPRGVELVAADAAGRLAGIRPNTTYEGQHAGEVIADLCSEAGAATGEIDDGPLLPVYVADGASTAWVHIGRLAALGSATARVDGDGAVVAVGGEPTAADIALRFGRELLDLRVTDAPLPPSGPILTGEGPGPADDRPGALRFTATAPAGAGGQGAPLSMAALRDREATGEAATAVATRELLRRRRIHARTWLQPHIGPSTLVEIQDTPTPVPLLQVRSVEHRLDAAGATTRLVAGPAPTADLLGSLGALLGGLTGGLAGAVGGLV